MQTRNRVRRTAVLFAARLKVADRRRADPTGVLTCRRAELDGIRVQA